MPLDSPSQLGKGSRTSEVTRRGICCHFPRDAGKSKARERLKCVVKKICSHLTVCLAFKVADCVGEIRQDLPKAPISIACHLEAQLEHMVGQYSPCQDDMYGPNPSALHRTWLCCS